jgi:hypothetical protein
MWHTCLPNASRNVTGTQDTDFYVFFALSFWADYYVLVKTHYLFVSLSFILLVLLIFDLVLPFCVFILLSSSPYLEVLLWLQGIVLTLFGFAGLWVMEIFWFFSKSAIRHSFGSTSWQPVTGIHDDHEAAMLCEWHNMTEPSVCFCQCNRDSVCRFCTVFCTNFRLVILYLSTPTVRSWWNQWLSIVACHSNSWWRWQSLSRGYKLQLHLLSYYFPIVVAEISLQFLRYLWLELTRLTALSLVFVFGFAGTPTMIPLKELLRSFFCANLFHVS